ncbi:Isovaleryl-CoA dehydrogenase [Hibiscus syriacus]|uniref:Isovaleryl-CoA dehydrogenase n=1 Tax=Hibiscus syriacus TaxID=106335 RepID=A0A6A2YW66_HIBSY|nr:Isovaleryl-CoA dehydrogenase [Hibiscus syriacus]
MGDFNLHGITAPEEYGGFGLGYLYHYIAMEEISHASWSVGLWYGAHSNLCINHWIRCFSMKCKADRVDGGYLLNGNKMWCTNGPVAQTLILQCSEIGQTWDVKKCELVFENCFVPEENVLGKEGKDFASLEVFPFSSGNRKEILTNRVYVLMSGLYLEILVLSAGPVGIMQACLDVVLPYIRERSQFGRPIGEFQFIQGKVADMYTSLQSSRSYGYSVARDCDNGRVDPKIPFIFPPELELYFLLPNETLKLLCRFLQAIQCLGGNGYVNEYTSGRLLRDAKLYEIGAGTSEIRRMAHSLGAPRLSEAQQGSEAQCGLKTLCSFIGIPTGVYKSGLDSKNSMIFSCFPVFPYHVGAVEVGSGEGIATGYGGSRQRWIGVVHPPLSYLDSFSTKNKKVGGRILNGGLSSCE